MLDVVEDTAGPRSAIVVRRFFRVVDDSIGFQFWKVLPWFRAEDETRPPSLSTCAVTE